MTIQPHEFVLVPREGLPRSSRFPLGGAGTPPAEGTGLVEGRGQIVGAAAGEWQLPAGHYVQAKMEPQIIHPRPDNETNSWERHRMAPEGVPWSIPIVVQGGAWPFEYTLVDGPSGMSIGRFLEEDGDVLVAGDDYGVLSWSNPAIGTHSITVRVRTQDYGRQPSGRTDADWGAKEISFDLVVSDKDDTTKFLWLDPEGNDANAGTTGSPKQNLGPIYASTNFGGRQIHLNTGTYNTNAGGQMAMSGTNQPAVIVGHGDAKISWTQRNFQPGAGTYVQGIEGLDGGYSTSNVRWFANGAGNRFTWFEVDFVDPPNGSSGSDNATAIFFNTGTQRNYLSIVRCNETGRSSGTSNATQLCVVYRVDNAVVEHCTVDDSGAQPSAYFKDGNQNITLRNNVFRNNQGFNGGTGAQNSGRATDALELCYSRFHNSIRMNVANSTSAGEHWFYRNSIKGDVSMLRRDDAGPYHVENNAIQDGLIGTGTQVTSTGNNEVNAASGVFGSGFIFNLTSTYNAYRGTRGAEVKA